VTEGEKRNTPQPDADLRLLSGLDLYLRLFGAALPGHSGAVPGGRTAHGFQLFYYDNRSRGEADYLIDDYSTLSTIPIEVKSGKDYTVHSALNTFVSNEDYHIQQALVLCNHRDVTTNRKILYLPIYYVMFLSNTPMDAGDLHL